MATYSTLVSFADMEGGALPHAALTTAAAKLGFATTMTETSFVAKEQFKFLRFVWPATLKVIPEQDGTVRVTASNFGLGPVQGKHVRGVALRFVEAAGGTVSERA